MNVALITNFFPPIQTGSSFWNHNWALQFKKRGHEVIVLTPSLDGSDRVREEASPDGLAVFRLPSTLTLPRASVFLNFDQFHLFYSRKNVTTVSDILRNHKVEFIHHSNHLLDALWVALKASDRLGVPCVGTVHSVIRHTANRVYDGAMRLCDKFVLKQYMKKLHGIVCLEAETKNYVDSVYGCGRSQLIPLCSMDQELFDSLQTAHPEVLNTDGTLIIASVGHVTQNRNRCEIVRALPEVIRAGHQPRLDIIGKVLTDDPLKLARSLGVEKYVNCLGEMKRADVLKHLAHCHMECHLLAMRGLGIASQEAMACALPVIAPVERGLYGTVPLQHGVNIWSAFPDDQAAVNLALTELANNQALRLTIGTNARALIGKYLLWENAAKSYEELFNSVLNGGWQRTS